MIWWYKLRAWFNNDPRQDPAFWQGYAFAFEVAEHVLRDTRTRVSSAAVAGPVTDAALFTLDEATTMLCKICNQSRGWARAHGQPA